MRDGSEELLRRIRGEYTEMPGLRLTEAQAQRLWGLDPATCSLVLATLVGHGFLRRGADGRYGRVDAEPAAARGRRTPVY